MRRAAIIGTAVFLLAGPSFAQDAAMLEKGRKVYDATMPKCGMCHSIAGKGNAKGPLDGVGDRLTAEDTKAWMRTPKQMTEKTKAARKPNMPAYPQEKLSDEDLAALTAYMLSLKS